MDKTTKNNLRRMWLLLLTDFSSIEKQKKEWLSNQSPSSYSEWICQYFDDLLTEETYNTVLKKKVITEEEIELIKPFHKALLNYKEPSKFDIDIINDHNWLHVTQIASECLEKLQRILTDADELNIIHNV